MLKTDIAALLALGAALFIAIGDVVHQRSARAVSDASVGQLGVFALTLIVAAAVMVVATAALARSEAAKADSERPESVAN